MVKKKESSREEDEKESFFFREEYEELEVLAIENHTLCFEMARILNVVLGFFCNKTWDYIIIWIDVFSDIKKYRLLQ